MSVEHPGETPPAAAASASKERLRREIRDRLRAMTADERDHGSRRIVEALRAEPEYANARSILFYVPIGSEPDLRPAIEEAQARGVLVLLPRSRRDPPAIELAALGAERLDQLPLDELRVPAPTGPAVDPRTVDLAVVPGVAFDADGGRLGRGGGFYDRLLAALSPATAVIGVCFERQLVERVPRESHDHRVQAVIAEGGRVRKTGPSGR
ncbi:MAG: 5-formyltetrahydrofolate cyclo-ligase [Phycisphaerales bacterium]